MTPRYPPEVRDRDIHRGLPAITTIRWRPLTFPAVKLAPERLPSTT
jgi:hypothetical protein